MESALAPRPCTDCDGEKVIAVRAETCNHAGCACPCGWGEEICARCEGSGVEPCTGCGEPSTIRYLGEDWCDGCAPAEEHRFDSCSLCERPIDVRESRLPLCPRCQRTCEAHAQLERDRREWDRERGAA